MNKIFFSIILFSAILFGIAGCNNRQNNSIPQSPESVAAVENAEVPLEETVDTSGFIGENRAKEIALETAGLKPKGVFFGRVELDNENDVWQYEVEFRKEKTEYEVVVDATDGGVISFETEAIDE